MSGNHAWQWSAAGMAVALLISGCGKKAVRPTANEVVEKAADESEADKPFRLEDVMGQEWKDVPQLAAVRFEVDQAVLGAEARGILQKNAKLLKEYPQVEVRVAGHCDERGTVEYNLALGQRRARAARDYYKSIGIAESRLSTISFGEERPLCSEESDDCWRRNRRAETKVRVLSLGKG